MATSACPRGAHRCECCGSEVDGIAIAVADSPVGPFCVAACPTCWRAIERGTPVPVSLGTAERLAHQHAEHVRAAGTTATERP